ncbi:protein SSUH2 homolog [Uloborus diversus]|uniref:protein SSUH2 homolog n=1 Tax=Uloborus diversus TaxID=327109 RepID=UPI00240911B4|nr:protein SSUH2 homolog [Uloborus diversus]
MMSAMDEMPPSYEEAKACAKYASAPCINEGYVPDDDVKDGIILPPTAPPIPEEEQRSPSVLNLPPITELDVREACLQYVSEHCCYGQKFARDAEYTEIKNKCTFHYKLETFGEKRESVQRFAPYKGQPIDGPENGPPPHPWSIQVQANTPFQDGKVQMEIPHTAYVKTCGTCVGNGRVRCSSCSGQGGSTCWNCGGRGRDNNERCTSCDGTGRKRCWTCNGTGQETCDTCDRRGKLKHYRVLIVTWKNHIDHFVTETSSLPKELILEAGGRQLCRDENTRVFPIVDAQDMSVNMASSNLLAKHGRAFPNEMIRKQRHQLRAVPLTRIRYRWKNKDGEFYVYGFQNKVYFESYPQKCCCCTCI